MAFGDTNKTKGVGLQSKAPKSSGGFGSTAKSKSGGKVDLSTSQGLADFATQKGYGDDAQEIVNPKNKLSALQRLSKGLGAFNPAEAILTGTEKGVVAGVGKYVGGVAKGIASAVTGTDYEGERRTFADVAEKAGIENKILKFGIGFLGDVLLDPSTYFGGALAKGLVAGTKLGTKTALKGIGKVAPDVEKGLTLTATGLQDAFGKAFQAGYKSSVGAKEDVLSFLSKRDKAKFGIAASNLNRLGTGVLTKSQSEELAAKLIAGKRAEFQLGEQLGETGAAKARQLISEARDTGDFSKIAEIDPKLADDLKLGSADEAVNAALEAQVARSKKFGEKLDLANPYETYFPFIKKDKLDGFLKNVDRSGIKVGSESYRKEFKNLLTNEQLELDPAKAFFTAEAQQVTDRMSRDFLGQFGRNYGVALDKFKDADEAAKAGYKLLREKGMFGKEVAWIPEYDAKLLNDLITPEFQTINTLAKATGFDAITNLFKRSVTGLFLPFHVRNYTSGIIQNFEVLGKDALNPKLINAGQKMAYRIGKNQAPDAGEAINILGKQVSMKKVYKAFEDRFGTDTFYHNDFLQAVENGGQLKQAEKTFSKSALRSTLGFEKGNAIPLLGNDAIPFRVARATGQFIEHSQKATAYLGALAQGKSIDEALRLAERAGFDYRSLTAFESQILRRIVPFYSFTRKNIELQMKTLSENPERINQVLSFFENIGERATEEEKKNLPDYLKGSIAVKLEDTPDGFKQYIASFGTPIEGFTDLFNKNPVLKAISMTNPLIKAPVEIGIGKDSFRQRDLKDVYTADEYKYAPKVIKKMLKLKEVEKPILKKDKDGKLKQVGTRTQYIADPERLLIARSLFTSRGVTYFNQALDDKKSKQARALRLLTGVNPQEIDIELQKALTENEKKRELEDLLKKTGETAQFTRSFIPDNKK